MTYGVGAGGGRVQDSSKIFISPFRRVAKPLRGAREALRKDRRFRFSLLRMFSRCILGHRSGAGDGLNGGAGARPRQAPRRSGQASSGGRPLGLIGPLEEGGWRRRRQAYGVWLLMALILSHDLSLILSFILSF